MVTKYAVNHRKYCAHTKLFCFYYSLLNISRGWSSLTAEQKDMMSKSADVVQCNVDTIEKVGGGGIRCMMAGIFADRI